MQFGGSVSDPSFCSEDLSIGNDNDEGKDSNLNVRVLIWKVVVELEREFRLRIYQFP